MNALQIAKELMSSTDTDTGLDSEFLTMYATLANAYAAIAQAEQLKRIADMMERYLSIQGVKMEFFEAQNRWQNESAE